MKALYPSRFTRKGIWRSPKDLFYFRLSNALIRADPVHPRRQYTTSDKPLPWSRHTLVSTSSPQAHSPNSLKSPKEQNIKHIAYIALGSNLGNRIEMIENACNNMAKHGINVTRTSSLWETEPMYVLEQDKFVNGVCEVS